MHRTRVGDEVESGPGIASEKLRRQKITLQTIAARTRQDDVAGDVRSAMRQRMHVVQRRTIEFQSRTAVNAAPAAVAHRCALDRPLLWASGDWFCPAADTRRAGEGDSVELPTSGQCHLAKKATPRSGNLSRSGVSRRSMKNGNSEEPSHCVALVIALRSVAVDTLDVGRVGSLASGGTRDRSCLRSRAPYKCNAVRHRASGDVSRAAALPARVWVRLVQQLAMRTLVHPPASGETLIRCLRWWRRPH